MIDISPSVFTKVKAAVLAVSANATIENQYQDTVTEFPYVTVIEYDNALASQTLDYKEDVSRLMYQVDVYVSGGGAGMEAMKIAMAISNVMCKDLKFKRTQGRPMPNADTSIYRYAMRFEGLIEETTGRVFNN